MKCFSVVTLLVVGCLLIRPTLVRAECDPESFLTGGILAPSSWTPATPTLWWFYRGDDDLNRQSICGTGRGQSDDVSGAAPCNRGRTGGI